MEALQDKIRSGEIESFIASAHSVGELKVVTATVPASTTDDLRRMGDFLRDRAANIVAVLAAVKEGKITFLAVCGAEAVKAGVKAGDIIRRSPRSPAARADGKPDSAMGGGQRPC